MIGKYWWIYATFLMAIITTAVTSDNKNVRKLRMNEIQVLGTHNSYHVEPPAEAMEFLDDVDTIILSDWAASARQTHSSLTDQLEKQGILQFELDVLLDPKGGRFVDPAALRINLEPLSEFVHGSRSVVNQTVEKVKSAAKSVASFATNSFNKVKSIFSREEDELMKPGFKVLHLQDFDYRTTCLTFIDCLQEIRRWHDQHPRHLPIHILVEAKDEEFERELKKAVSEPVYAIFVSSGIVPLTKVLFIGKQELYDLEQEVLSVFERELIVTPDDVRGSHATLDEAVKNSGWPYLDDVLGKFVFTLLNKRDLYIEDSPTLANRLFFTRTAPPGAQDRAMMILDDPTMPSVNESILEGYIVRVRADTVEHQDVVHWNEQALNGGAQLISTDYPAPENGFNPQAKGYSVHISPRCNKLLVDGPCPLFTHGGWSEWSTTDCTQACNKSETVELTRTCTAPAPANGGNLCEGSHRRVANCSESPCSAQFRSAGKWSQWGECYILGSSCYSRRTRECGDQKNCAKVQVKLCNCGGGELVKRRKRDLQLGGLVARHSIDTPRSALRRIRSKRALKRRISMQSSRVLG